VYRNKAGVEVVRDKTRSKRAFLVGMETDEGERVPEASAVNGLGA
jgi:hypothetical protein